MSLLSRFFRGLFLIGAAIVVSSCVLGQLIPAQKRPFSSQELLLTQEGLPSGIIITFGPHSASEDSKPDDSMEVGSSKEPVIERWEIMERAYIFSSVEWAKEDYSEMIGFPGETDIEGWTFISRVADEQKFSCYTYSNYEYPVCRWVARYDEIILEVIAWVNPDRWTIGELQGLVEQMDEKIASYLSP